MEPSPLGSVIELCALRFYKIALDLSRLFSCLKIIKVDLSYL